MRVYKLNSCCSHSLEVNFKLLTLALTLTFDLDFASCVSRYKFRILGKEDRTHGAFALRLRANFLPHRIHPLASLNGRPGWLAE